MRLAFGDEAVENSGQDFSGEAGLALELGAFQSSGSGDLQTDYDLVGCAR